MVLYVLPQVMKSRGTIDTLQFDTEVKILPVITTCKGDAPAQGCPSSNVASISALHVGRTEKEPWQVLCIIQHVHYSECSIA
jgi:hypothetical protein